MFFSKSKDQVAKVKAAIETKDLNAIWAAFEVAIVADGIDSKTSHELAVLIQTHGLPFLEFLEYYVKSNPNMITSAELRAAEMYAENRNYDMATVKARALLRKLLAWDEFKNGTAGEAFIGMASGCYLVMSSAFTFAGARSYSLRLLNRALDLPTSSRREFVQNEIATLQKELAEPANADIDQKWEEFFANGQNAVDLYKLCERSGLPYLARRVDLLEGNFRFNAAFQITADEAVLEVVEVQVGEDSEKKSYALQ